MPRTRRSISPQFKAQAVLDLLTGVSNQAEICRQHQLSPALVARWKAILAPPSARQLQLAEGVEFPERNAGFGSLTTVIWRRGSPGRTANRLVASFLVPKPGFRFLVPKLCLVTPLAKLRFASSLLKIDPQLSIDPPAVILGKSGASPEAQNKRAFEQNSG